MTGARITVHCAGPPARALGVFGPDRSDEILLRSAAGIRMRGPGAAARNCVKRGGRGEKVSSRALRS